MAWTLRNVNIDVLRTPHGLLKLAEMVRIHSFLIFEFVKLINYFQGIGFYLSHTNAL